MKKIIALLLVIFISFTTFVSAQDTANNYKQVTFYFDEVTMVKDSTPVDKCGNFELTFSSTPGLIFFRDRDTESLLKVVLGKHILDEPLTVWYKNEKVPATAMCFEGTINDMDIIFSTVILSDKNLTVYAFGITLDKYSLLLRVPERDK
jgi:hypothetical protein